MSDVYSQLDTALIERDTYKEQVQQLHSRLSTLEQRERELVKVLEETATHLSAIEEGLLRSKRSEVSEENISYWEHEIKAFRVYSKLIRQANSTPSIPVWMRREELERLQHDLDLLTEGRKVEGEEYKELADLVHKYMTANPASQQCKQAYDDLEAWWKLRCT